MQLVILYLVMVLLMPFENDAAANESRENIFVVMFSNVKHENRTSISSYAIDNTNSNSMFNLFFDVSDDMKGRLVD